MEEYPLNIPLSLLGYWVLLYYPMDIGLIYPLLGYFFSPLSHEQNHQSGLERSQKSGASVVPQNLAGVLERDFGPTTEIQEGFSGILLDLNEILCFF